MNSPTIRSAAEAICSADALLIGAGAGMGVDSGLPDFRGDEGFWKAYPPLKNLGISFYQMADPIWFPRDPRQAWGFYGHRLSLYRATKPHDGFQHLKRMSQACRLGCFVFTSNVDGHFHFSGFDSDRIVECHGSIHHLQCSAPCCDEIWTADDVNVNVDESTFLAEPPLPSCPQCGSVARPNILMFGDASWLPDRTSHQQQRYSRWQSLLDSDVRLVGIEIGAGTAVPTVRYELERQTRGRSSTLIRINPQESSVADGISIGMGGAAAIEAILDFL
jgi:NAD-dependent SIR2 family protein deacetylase